MLKAKITKAELDALDPILQREYKPMTGNSSEFVIDVGAVSGWNLEDVGGLRSALERTKDELKGAKEKLTAFDGLDAAVAREALEKVKTIGNLDKDAQVKTLVETAVSEARRNHKRELDTRDETIRSLNNELDQSLVDTLGASIMSGKGSWKLIRREVMDNAVIEKDGAGRRVVRIKNSTGGTRISGRAGQQDNMMGLEEFITDVLAKDQEWARAFTPSEGGSGASGSESGDAAGGAGSTRVTRDRLATRGGDLIAELAVGKLEVTD